MCAWRSPFSYRMEESDVFDDIPELYSDRLRKCIAVCIAFHSEDRHDAFDLFRVIQRARNDPSTQHLAKAPPIAAGGGELNSTGESSSQTEEREKKLQTGKGESAGGGPSWEQPMPKPSQQASVRPPQRLISPQQASDDPRQETPLRSRETSGGLTHAGVSAHNIKRDLSRDIYNNVYNASSFVDEHP
jgi:hypothetical protein